MTQFLIGIRKMNLSAPTLVIFIVSIIIAALGILAGLGVMAFLPIPAFWLVTIGFLVLVAGCLFSGV